MSLGTQLADWLREQARWRHSIAEEYEDDTESDTQARRLEHAAREIESVPDSAQLLQRMQAKGAFSRGYFVPNEGAKAVVRKWGRRRNHSMNLLWLELMATTFDEQEAQALQRRLQGRASQIGWRIQRTKSSALDGPSGISNFKVVDAADVRVLGEDDQPVSLLEIEAEMSRAIKALNDRRASDQKSAACRS